MTTQYWLVKSEPESYAWETFLKDRRTIWDGVRNFQARNNLRAMRVGDRVLFYASGGPKAVQGTAKVVRAAFPDPKTPAGEDWSAVELEADATLPQPVTLSQIKGDPELKKMELVRLSRISVVGVTADEFRRIVKFGSGK